MYAFGLGGVGQLGNKMATSLSTPQVVLGPWLSNNADEKYTVRRIYAGGDQCFITLSRKQVRFCKYNMKIKCIQFLGRAF